MFNMERDRIIKKQISLPHSPSSTLLGLHKNSQTISKMKPKIRIIHIFAPEIIKTDVDNFRELVQRLTGKPNEVCKTIKTRKIVPKKQKPVSTKMELLHGLHSQEFSERIKGEEEIWRGANSGGGFLGNFPELEGGFMAEFNGFSLFNLDATSSQIDAYEEPSTCLTLIDSIHIN